MNTKYLGIFGVLLALTCWLGLLAMRNMIFGQTLGLLPTLIEMILVSIGSTLFWRWIIATLNRQAREVRQRTRHLEALHAASISLTNEHDLITVLQKVVDLSRTLLNAKYGALGVLDEEGTGINQMITSGMSEAARNALVRFPHSGGLLGATIHDQQPIRVAHISSDPRSSGFPVNHPPMHSFLGVPIVSKGRIFGNLYLTDKQPSPDHSGPSRSKGGPLSFTEEDQEILEMFANQAAIAIENAQLYRQNEQIAIFQERERFGMDLHDGVIQSIYAIGLMLDANRHRLEADPEAVRAGLDSAITSLNQVIKDIRSYIHDLRTSQFAGRDLQQGLEELARDLQTYSILRVDLNIDPKALKKVPLAHTKDLIQIAREALTNIRKHAHATSVQVDLSCAPAGVLFAVADNGVGINHNNGSVHQGHGLRNMRERTENLHGKLEIDSRPEGGTRIAVLIPA